MAILNKSSIHKLSDNEIVRLVEENTSISKILQHLNIKKTNFYAITLLKNRIIFLNINTAHFINELVFPRQLPLNEVMVENSTYARSCLKKRLLKDGILKNECSECGVKDIWNNKPISIQLDHINGIYNDHRLENLRMLCPNCHSQTGTFAGKNNRVENFSCIDCKIELAIKRKKSRCLNCYDKFKIDKKNKTRKPRPRKVSRPSKEDLFFLMWKNPSIIIAKEFGVSSRAIGKWAKSYNIPKPPRGYWAIIQHLKTDKEKEF